MIQRVLICTLVFGLMNIGTLQSQSTNSAGEVYAQIAIPTHEFASTYTARNAFFGLGLGGYWHPIENFPLTFVPSIRYYWMGSESRTFEEETVFGDPYEVTFELRSAMIPLNFHARIDLLNYVDFPILPYIGAYCGPRILFSTERETYDYFDGNEPQVEKDILPSHLNFHVNGGLEAGIRIPVSEKTFLDIRFEKSLGSSSRYIDMASVLIDDYGSIDYQIVSSRTNMVAVTVGVCLIF